MLLHLGMPKTGTSLLQNAIKRAAGHPGYEHICYPEYGRASAVAHHDLARGLRTADSEALRRAADGLLTEIHGHARVRDGNAVALVSSEDFTNSCVAGRVWRLAEFSEALGSSTELQCVIVVRELSDFFESMYLQSSRTGHVSSDFEDYLLSRVKWAEQLLRGLVELRGRLGARLTIHYREPDFDVLGYFAGLLSCSAAGLRDVTASLRSTAKPSLKNQAALTFLPDVEERLGFAIDRRRLGRLLARTEVFAEDTSHFTLFDESTRSATWERCRAIARDAGLVGYAQAFDLYRPNSAKTVALTPDLLMEADLLALRQHRESIAVPGDEAA